MRGGHYRTKERSFIFRSLLGDIDWPGRIIQTGKGTFTPHNRDIQKDDLTLGFA